jgi:DNA-binding transcriptional LysR family regulator
VIRVGTLSDSGLIARPLGRFHLYNCASPDYLARYGTPRNLDDLAGHQLIHYVPSLGGRSAGFEYMEGGENRARDMSGSITVNNSDAYLAACLAGFGIIQVPEVAVRELLAQGRLVEVLSTYSAAPLPVSLLYANRHHLPKRTQRFMYWVAEVMRDYG